MISIDPGIHALGWAEWTLVSPSPGLLRAGVSRAEGRELGALAEIHARQVPQSVIIVLESMTVRGAGSNVPAQDLIDVQTVGCLTARALGRTVTLLRPSDWKHGIPKGVHHGRIAAALDPAERLVAESAAHFARSNAKEVWDAIGIGLFWLKRTTKTGEKRIT